MRYLGGIDIGGTKCAVTLGALQPGGFRILKKEKIETRARDGAAQTICRLLEAAERVFSGDEKPAAIGISAGGPLNSEKGLILSPPNLPGWDNIAITELVEKRFGVSAFLQNDANACALAEWKFGAGKGCKNMVFLTFGTGMGAGLILNGQLYAGASGMAGEVGHIRLADDGPMGYGKQGSFEGFCSGGGIARLAALRIAEKRKKGNTPAPAVLGDALTARDIAELATGGDTFSLSVMEQCGTMLGRGLSLLVDILNPQRIVIGSIFARSGSLLIPAMEKSLRAEALSENYKDCTIVPAALGELVGDYAALCVAADGAKLWEER